LLASLSGASPVVDRQLAAVKLAELADRVERIRRHCPATADGLRGDRDALDLVSFNFMLAVQTCADIASHLIADEGWPSAANLAAGFNRLRDERVISDSTAASLSKAVGLRNVVAQGYAGINPAMVHAAAIAGLRDLDAFAKEVARWIAARSAELP
jgi:uncharacterized protein YutE (UPF0331/DUF86 family)